MRVQVYSEELGEGVEIVEKVADTGTRFYGLRVWLKTCQALIDHSTPEDDDRSAVTFWARSREELYRLVDQMARAGHWRCGLSDTDFQSIGNRTTPSYGPPYAEP